MMIGPRVTEVHEDTGNLNAGFDPGVWRNGGGITSAERLGLWRRPAPAWPGMSCSKTFGGSGRSSARDARERHGPTAASDVEFDETTASNPSAPIDPVSLVLSATLPHPASCSRSMPRPFQSSHTVKVNRTMIALCSTTLRSQSSRLVLPASNLRYSTKNISPCVRGFHSSLYVPWRMLKQS